MWLDLPPNHWPSGFSLRDFPNFIFCRLFPFSSILFAHIWDVAARVWRTPDSHYVRTINTHQEVQTANTTNKCRPGAHRAPINKLGIIYHQYCSSSTGATGSRRIVEGHGDDVLLFVGCCVCACSPVRGGERREILGRWSLGLQLKNLNKGFNTKKPRDSSFSRWLAGCLIFLHLHTKE